ncbi:MAG: tetratricopeptide repeat protein [Bryobacteraceae bacterium]|nr:tetratricopeptide repeat protein [Bryobacterales bacterium]NUN00830.1 tetratricopeptide repeat protein [Bryobacteraceae bacterium]
MRVFCLFVLVVFVISAPVFGASREMVQLQRDVSLLQDDVRSLQRTVDEKLATLNTLIQQTLDNVNKANTNVAVLDSNLRDKLRDQEKMVAAPVAGLNSRLEQMASEFQALKETIADMNGRMGKLQAQVTDLGSTIKVLSSPPPPPPGLGVSPEGPPPGTSAESLYSNALRDQSGGRFDLALQQFTDYVAWFGDTDLAPNAQFYIGSIQYNRGEFESALKSFDMVLEKYPQNNKTLDARYMKGMSLVKMGQRNAAVQEFRALIKTAPSSEQATKSKAQLKILGMPYAPAASRKRR